MIALARLPPKLLVLTLITSGLTACSPRYELFRAETPDARLVVEGQPTHRDSLVDISFDFWSPEGIPFLSLYNRSPDTLLLDLSASGVATDREQGSLANLLGMERRRVDLTRDFPEFELVREDGSVLAVLAPDNWVGFEVGPLTDAKVRRTGASGRGRDRIRHRLSYTFSLRLRDTVHTVVQRVEAKCVDLFYPRELDKFEWEEATARYYFRDRHWDRDEVLFGMMDILLSL